MDGNKVLKILLVMFLGIIYVWWNWPVTVWGEGDDKGDLDIKGASADVSRVKLVWDNEEEKSKVYRDWGYGDEKEGEKRIKEAVRVASVVYSETHKGQSPSVARVVRFYETKDGKEVTFVFVGTDKGGMVVSFERDGKGRTPRIYDHKMSKESLMNLFEKAVKRRDVSERNAELASDLAKILSMGVEYSSAHKIEIK